MIFIQKLAVLFFNLIDRLIHQKKILHFLKQERVQIDTWFDIGSHKGLYTDLIKNNFTTKKAFLFEPQKDIFKFIKKKYKSSKNIYLFNYAVSDSQKTQNIYINKHDLTSSLTKMNEKNLYLKVKAKLFGGNLKDMITNQYSVKTISLSYFLKQKKINKIDLIKIDTEGHELNVLKGLRDKIKIVKNILIEFHNNKIYLNYSSEKIHKYLIKNNFVLKKKIKFPFTEWEDRIYENKKINSRF